MFQLVLVYLLVAQAKVAPFVIPRDEDSSISKRTMFNIVWGCVSTTIICAWAAVHPNIAPREGPLKRTLRRLELMFWTIVAPEILPCWALNQLFAAKMVRDVYNTKGKCYETKGRGLWKTLKEWPGVSLCEIKEAAKPCGYLSGFSKTLKGWVSLYEIKEASNPVWTLAHGHFLIMGGFHVVEPPEVLDRSIQLAEANTDMRQPLDLPTTSLLLLEETNMETGIGRGPSEKRLEGRVTILTLEMLQELVNDPDFEIHMTEEEIMDRSKGDALSKLIFILQSTWFILQCIERRVEGLNLTHLELTTLALASLNGITFLLWWKKPLGAQAIVRIHLKRKLKESERVSQESRSMRSDMIIHLQVSLKACVATIRDAFRCQSFGLVQLPLAIIYILLFPIIAFTFALFATVMDIIQANPPSFPPDETHVPTFYAPKHHKHGRMYHILLLLSLGVAFGGIHCFGWNFSFSNYAEKKLWRFACLAVTTIPIVAFPFVVIIFSMTSFFPSITHSFFHGLSKSTFIFCALVYVSARLVLLGLALALLKHLPPTAFIDIDWSKFYPHFVTTFL